MRTRIHTKRMLCQSLFCCWTCPVFIKGLKKDLAEDDLNEDVKSHDSSILGDKLEKAWQEEIKKRETPSLWRVLWKKFWKRFLMGGFFYFITEFILRLSQPILISKLLQYYVPNQKIVSREISIKYAVCLILVSFGIVVIGHVYILDLYHLGMKMRVSCSSLIYRKSLKLSRIALADTTVGQMVNLLSNDVSRFDMAPIHAHYLWGAPLEAVIVFYFLYRDVGPTALSGTLFLLIFLPLQMYIGKKVSSYRLETAVRTDKRILLMNEIISGIRVIKMYTWEKPFAALVEVARKSEIEQIRKNSMIKALTLSFPLFINRTAIYLCILTYVLTGHTPSAQYVYVVASYYAILRQSITLFLPHAILTFSEANICVKRIEKFLLYEEISTATNEEFRTSKNQILLRNVFAKWSPTAADYTLHQINLMVSQNELVAIVGSVGSGKSSLLNLILKELPILDGSLQVTGTISYAPQDPWIFSSSIRKNILFGRKYDAVKYEKVVNSCALRKDFELFPNGDKTLVGDRGLTLSGGQRARVSLARAIYKDADIYLLDDPLSAVDSQVGKMLFEDCIYNHLRNKCVVLVTHQLQYLKNVSKIFVMENGRIVSQESFKDLKNNYSKMNCISDSDEGEVESKQKTVRKMSIYENMIEKEDGRGEMKENKEIGKVSGKNYKRYFLSGGNWIKCVLIYFMFLLVQMCESGSDYFLAFWINLGETRNISSQNTPNLTHKDIKPVYNFWESNLNTTYCLIIYSSVSCLIIIITLTRSVTFFRFCMKASVKLHNDMFDKIVKASLSFFNSNPPGRILNRFSKDIGTIDESLPATMFDALQIVLTAFGSTMVVSTINPWLLIPTFIILVIYYWMRRVFLSSSRSLKRMEGITRSPVYSHLTTSIQGLSTIRAFEAQKSLTQQFDAHQNKHSAAFYMFMTCNRSFGFWLDLTCVVYTSMVILSFFFIKNETYGGNVGLAITQSIALTGVFQWGMKQWSEWENQMTSVERIAEYIDIEQEPEPNQNEHISESWPLHGSITYDSVSLKYATNSPFILKEINFCIQPKEKVGIVGRTGAGKSSLIAALFRLTPIEGKVIIDDIDTKDIPLTLLRSNISIIPQEPFLFTGTVRKNLDPFHKCDDTTIWKVLEVVELKNTVAALPHGLDYKLFEGGSNFSIGQRQLLCLARAIITKNKILVLDEATANVDHHTDSLIQSTIRDKFADCTVLTIAHRLRTIMDSDKVLVMDGGRLVEFDEPRRLLKNKEGVFYELVKEAGINFSDYKILNDPK